VRKKSWVIGMGLVLLGLAAGWAAMGAVARNHRYIPPLKVIGDVAEVLTLQNPDSLGGTEKITFRGNGYQAVKLADIIAKAGPGANAEKLYLIGLDGFTAAIGANDIDDCYLSFTAENGWEAINLAHPNSSNVKLLSEIVVASDGSGGDFTFDIISPETDLVQTTPGRLLAGPLMLYPYAEGDAVVQNGGKDYEVQVFTRRRVFKISDLTPLQDGDRLLVMDEKGENRLADNSGYFEVNDNHINYLEPDTRTRLERVRGVIMRPPAASITDAYYEARHYLENGDRLLLVVLEGLNYHQYSYAVANGYAPFLGKAGKAVQACGVYPPVSNVGLAALLTGKAPPENGIVTAGDHTSRAPSIFAEAIKLNKKAVFLDAGQTRLNTETEPIAVTDENGEIGRAHV
jgi:hypothetical protein